MNARRRSRLNPLAVDRTLAVLLSIAGELEIWLSNEVPQHRLAAALIVPLVTGSLAVRRRYPAFVGTVVPVIGAIQRELHDAIAHNVSMMVVQAGAERRVLDGANVSTREVLVTIEQIGRGALTEMRRLVGVLRNGEQPTR